MICTRSAFAFGLAAILAIPFASSAQQTKPVDRLKTQYETHRHKIDAEALAAYSTVLVAVGKQLQQKADVPGYLILKSEQTFLVTKQALPEGEHRTNLISKLPVLNAPLSRIEADRNAKMVNLLKQYIPAIEAQIRQFMTEDKLDEAKAAGEVKSSAELLLTDLQSKLPKSESRTGKSAIPTQEKQQKTLPPAYREVTVDGDNPRGTIIGTFKKGDKITVEYVSGKWKLGDGEWVNPDSERPDWRFTPNICLTRKDKEVGRTAIPTRTLQDPFAYECVEDGTYRIRCGGSGSVTGSVRYKVTRAEGQSKEESAQ